MKMWPFVVLTIWTWLFFAFLLIDYYYADPPPWVRAHREPTYTRGAVAPDRK